MSDLLTRIQFGVRRLRGKSQACLIKGKDNLFYVAKFAGNPKGNLSLINEWIACRILQQLGVSTPSVRLLQLNSEIQQREQFHFVRGCQVFPVEGELHLGSPLPCDPNEQTIWDFLPRRLLPRVTNLEDFAITFVFDLWTQKKTRRQAVFVRVGSSPYFRAYMIDHSSSFTSAESGMLSQRDTLAVCSPGIYFDEKLYALLSMDYLCKKAAEAIENLPSMQVCVESVPKAWLTAETSEMLVAVFRKLERRRTTLRDEIAESLDFLYDSASRCRPNYQ